jgi:hypothetical protein
MPVWARRPVLELSEISSQRAVLRALSSHLYLLQFFARLKVPALQVKCSFVGRGALAPPQALAHLVRSYWVLEQFGSRSVSTGHLLRTHSRCRLPALTRKSLNCSYLGKTWPHSFSTWCWRLRAFAQLLHSPTPVCAETRRGAFANESDSRRPSKRLHQARSLNANPAQEIHFGRDWGGL